MKKKAILSSPIVNALLSNPGRHLSVPLSVFPMLFLVSEIIKVENTGSVDVVTQAVSDTIRAMAESW